MYNEYSISSPTIYSYIGDIMWIAIPYALFKNYMYAKASQNIGNVAVLISRQ